MKRLGDYIKSCIKEEGRTSQWVAEKLGINYKTFVGKLNRNSITADDLLKMSVLLDIDLENMKEDLGYNSAFSDQYVYVTQSHLVEDELLDFPAEDELLNIEDIVQFDKVPVYKTKMVGTRGVDSSDMIESIYLFVPIEDEFGNLVYELRLCHNVRLKEVVDEGFMEKHPHRSNAYMFSRRSRLRGNVMISRRAESNIAGNVATSSPVVKRRLAGNVRISNQVNSKLSGNVLTSSEAVNKEVVGNTETSNEVNKSKLAGNVSSNTASEE